MLRNPEGKELYIVTALGAAVLTAAGGAMIESQANTNIINNARIAYAGNLTPEAAYLQVQGAKLIDVRTNKPFDTVSEALQACGEFSFNFSQPNMPEGPAGESIVKKHTLLPGEVTVIDGGGVGKEFQVNNYTLFKPQDPGHYINIILADNGWKADGSPVNAEVDVRAPGQQTVEIKGQLTNPEGMVDGGTLDQMLLNRLEEVVKYHANANQLTVGVYFAKGGPNGTPLWMEFDFRNLQQDIVNLKAKIAQNCAKPTPEKNPSPVTSSPEVLGLPLLSLPIKEICHDGQNMQSKPQFETPDAPLGTMQQVSFVVKKGTRLFFSTGGAEYLGRVFSSPSNEKQYHVFEAVEGDTGYSVNLPKGGYSVMEQRNALDNLDNLHSGLLFLALSDKSFGQINPNLKIDTLKLVRYNGRSGLAEGRAIQLQNYTDQFFGLGACNLRDRHQLFVTMAGRGFEAAPVINSPEQPKVVNLPDFVPVVPMTESDRKFFADFSKIGPEIPNGPDLQEVTFEVGRDGYAMWDGGRIQIDVMENGQLKTYEAGYDNANPNMRGRVILLMEGGQREDGEAEGKKITYKVKINRGVVSGGSVGPKARSYAFAKRIDEIDQFKDWQANDNVTLISGRVVNKQIVFEDLTSNWKQYRDKYLK